MFYTINVVKILQKNYKKVEYIMENKQMTKAQALEMALESIKEPQELVEKLETMLAQQKKQDSAKRNKKGTSKVAKEKAENMDKVRAFFSEMTEQNALTLAEIGQAIGLDDATPQKLSAIMKPLVDNNEFEKVTKDKKVAYQAK